MSNYEQPSFRTPLPMAGWENFDPRAGTAPGSASEQITTPTGPSVGADLGTVDIMPIHGSTQVPIPQATVYAGDTSPNSADRDTPANPLLPDTEAASDPGSTGAGDGHDGHMAHPNNPHDRGR